MIDEYLIKLKEKYSYDDKTVSALSKIIPNMIKYYGNDYEDLILNAIFDCEIIPCNLKETISKIKSLNSLSNKIGVSDIASIEIKGSESSYISDVLITYDDLSNKYNISKVNRVIATSHTYNYDSPKGLEVLTYALCKLVKSYNNEFEIDENILVKRTGLEVEKRHILKEEDSIYLDLISHIGHGLEEGLNIYDTSCIVSLILQDEYKCYDYDSIYMIAKVLKEKFNLKETLNNVELTGNFSLLNKNYEEDNLKEECDMCLFLENEMFISVTREDKDDLALKINNKLNKDVFKKLIDIYIDSNSKQKEKIF